MKYPTTPDVYGLHSVIDYKRLIEQQAGTNKVVASKKKFTKKENIRAKQRMHRMQNK